MLLSSTLPILLIRDGFGTLPGRNPAGGTSNAIGRIGVDAGIFAGGRGRVDTSSIAVDRPAGIGVVGS